MPLPLPDVSASAFRPLRLAGETKDKQRWAWDVQSLSSRSRWSWGSRLPVVHLAKGLSGLFYGCVGGIVRAHPLTVPSRPLWVLLA